mmetsp:Transcript_74333/g.166751  ORF Transcript_74333/g.166751 Transcript_74333/m.166751 type:complete len:219 (-) Transcript_74333:440-1096(-)
MRLDTGPLGTQRGWGVNSFFGGPKYTNYVKSIGAGLVTPPLPVIISTCLQSCNTAIAVATGIWLPEPGPPLPGARQTHLNRSKCGDACTRSRSDSIVTPSSLHDTSTTFNEAAVRVASARTFSNDGSPENCDQKTVCPTNSCSCEHFCNSGSKGCEPLAQSHFASPASLLVAAHKELETPPLTMVNFRSCGPSNDSACHVESDVLVSPSRCKVDNLRA